MSKNIKEILHAKREETEKHIKQLEKAGKQGIRYTAEIPDMEFLVLGMLCDIGWIIHLIAGIIYFSKNDITYAADWLNLISLVGVVIGVVFTCYLNKIHEKEIATRFQKNMSFGLTIFGGLFGAVIAVFQMAVYAGFSVSLLMVIIGGILNFCTGLPIFLSFKKGIKYGIQ